MESRRRLGRIGDPSATVYLEDDFIMNLLETVLDYILKTEVMVNAFKRSRDERWNEVRGLDISSGLWRGTRSPEERPRRAGEGVLDLGAP